MKSYKNSKNSKKGMVIIELIIALSIFTLIVMSVVITFQYNNAFVNKIQFRRQALYKTKNLLEDTFSVAQSFQSLTSQATTTDGIFFKKIDITDITPCKKKVVAKTSWSVYGLNQTIEFSAVHHDPQYLIDTESDCEGGEPSSAWKNIVTPIQSTGVRTDAINDLDVLNNIAVIGSDHTDPSYSGISIFNINSEHAFEATSNMDIGTGVNAVVIAGKYLYAALQGTSSQLTVIDIHNPAQPTIIAQKTLPGISGSYPSGRSIFYYKSKIFIGTHRTSGHEFMIYDVQNPKHPQWLSSLKINHNINKITVRDSYAYLATSADTHGLYIINISDPVHPQQLTTVTFPGQEDVTCLYLIGNNLYVGRKQGSTQYHPEFIVLDITNPSVPSIRSSYFIKATITGIRVAGNYAFLTTTDPNATFQIFDIHDLNHITQAQTYSLDAEGTALHYVDDKTYITTSNPSRIYSFLP